MQDKTFLQAMQDLQDRIAGNYQKSIGQMLLHCTTATDATMDIQDEKVRVFVTNELITGQIIALLAFMRDLCFIDRTQYDEFSSYLLRALSSQQNELISGHNSK